MADDRELIARLRLVYDQQSAAQAKASAENVKKGVEGVGTSAKASQSAIKGMGEAMKMAGLAGTAALGAAGLMISKYQAAAGLGESTSRQWALTTHDLEMSFVGVGRSIEQSLLPYLERAAALAAQVAKFAGNNPGAVKGGLATAGALTAGGAIAGLAVKMFGPIGGAIVAMAMGNTAIIGGGVAAGNAFGNMIGTTTASKQLYAMGAGGLAYSASRLTGSSDAQAKENANNAFMAVAKTLGLVTDEASKASESLGVLPQEMKVYTQYLRQEAQAKEEYGIQVSRATRDFTRQQLVAEQDFTIQRGRQLRDFNYGLMTQEQDYYRQRTIAARDFSIEVQRTEEDHQRSLLRSQQDHEWNMKKIIMEGDGMAFWEENRQYNLTRSRGEEDYQISMQRSNQDYALSLQDQEAQYQIQRNRQLVEYARQQADQEADFERQRKLALQQFQISRNDQQADFDRQRAIAAQAFNDQLRDLGGFWTNMQSVQNSFTSQMIADYQNKLNGAMQGKDLIKPSAGGASGIKLLPGMSYMVGENTGAPEIIKMGAGMSGQVYPHSSGARGLGGGLTYNDHRVFARGLSPEERTQIRRETEQLLYEVINGTAV